MFDNVVIVAMENQNYCSGVIVCGLSSTSFIPGLAAAGSIDPNYQGYGASGRSISGCSAGCYLALTSGSDQGKSDGYCPRASAPCLTVTNLVTSLTTVGLTWQAYCAEGCPRGSDHFPFLAYSNTNPGNCAVANTCSDTFMSSGVSTSSFIAAANSASPPNLLWYTPTDSENMHDNSVSSGDTYIKNFLVGTGTIASPASGSLFASSLFQPGHRTLFILWWDENSNPPEIFYGTGIKSDYLSTATYDHFSVLRMLEDNWNLPTLSSNDKAATGMLTEFTTIQTPLSASFTYLPSTPRVNGVVSFTASASGGTSPYTYSWNFGDGGTARGLTATHSYLTSGVFTTTLTVTDSASPTQTKNTATQLVTVQPSGDLPVTGSYSFYGVTVALSGSLNLTSGSISGTVSVTATNSTNGKLLFSKTYAISNLTLSNNGVRFLLNIGISPYPLSANLSILQTGGVWSATVSVTRQLDVNHQSTVNLVDFSTIAADYGVSVGSPNYNPAADLTGSGTVNIIDIGIIGLYYNSTVFY